MSSLIDAVLLLVVLLVVDAKHIRIEVRGEAACSLDNKSGTFAMLELFLDKEMRGVNYFDGQYGAIELRGDTDVDDGKTVTPRVKVTHNCFTTKHETSFIITFDPTEETTEIKLPSILDLKDLTHFSFVEN